MCAHPATIIQQSIPSIVTYDAKNVGFAPYGEYWRQSKSMYVLHLLSGRIFLMYKQVREDETNLMIDQIQNTSGSIINLSEILMSLINDVICQIVMGKKNSSKKIMGQMGELMKVLSIFSIGNYFPSLSWVDRLSDHLHTNKELVAGDKGDESVVGRDLVYVLLEIQREQAATTNVVFHKDAIKAFIQEMFVVGTDTTSTSLEWAISELIRHPRVMKKLQQKVGGIAKGKGKIIEEDLEIIKHPYLEAVLKETLRLHTPFHCLDPMVWEDADEFKPERFLNNNIDYKGLNFEFLPFGAGRRGCPAIQFGMAITKIALANLVYKFNFELPNKGIVKELDM
ncbi:cytochrome P450 71A2-like protein, partial [Tanacetum coccineum]